MSDAMFHYYFVEAMLDESNVVFGDTGFDKNYDERRLTLCEADEMYLMGVMYDKN